MSDLERFRADLRADLRAGFDPDITEDAVEHACGIAVGAASACWENLRGAGVFEDARARVVVDELVEFLRERGAR